MEGPLISIIIPVFNASDTILDCLASVVRQTWRNREIIVVDGGSEPSTLEKINTYSQEINCFISEPDQGVYDAINKGIDKAQGDWIYVLGADDRMADDKVLEHVFTVPLKSEKLVFGRVQQTHISNALVRRIHISKLTSAIYWKNTLHQQSVFYHRSLFYNFRFNTRYKVLADYDFHLKLFMQSTFFREIPLTIAICRAGGLSKQFNTALYREELNMKKHRLRGIFLLINYLWVWIKYFMKKVTTL
jgi:glycosyltransferase involved in cell wall biosynthesis